MGRPFFLLNRTMLDVEFTQLSDPGRVRSNNEDYLGHARVETGWLFALADGVGGQDKGEVASRTAIESLLTGFRQSPPGELHTAVLPRLVQNANIHVHEAGMASGRGGITIATTLVACGLRFDRATVAHVGDSRC